MGKDLAIAEAQLRDYQARLGKPFTLDSYLAELTTLRDQLKAGLSATAHEPGKEEGPSVSELAERIKAMKAANSVEATPQRVGQKQSTAEEPITARIRRRSGVGHESEAISMPGHLSSHAGMSTQTASEAHTDAERQSNSRSTSAIPPSSYESTAKPQMTFQERLERERRRKDPEPSLP